VQAAGVDTQAHIQEIAQLVQSALQQSDMYSDLAALSTSEINNQIHSTIEEAIKNQQQQKTEAEANSKLGFLQKVVTLECFFGGSDCLFRDKESMMKGKVTEFAKKRFEHGNPNVEQYLSQMNSQINTGSLH
jgi:hypothetical protein